METIIDMLPVIVVVAVMAVAWLLLRNKATVSTEPEFDNLIGQGQPVVVKFFRNT